MQAILDWLRFANLQLPARLGNAVLDHFGSLEAVFAASPDELAALSGLTDRKALLLSDDSYVPTDRQIRFLQKAGVHAVDRSSGDYPRNLREISDAPPVLFVRGRLDEKDRFAVSLVGSRHASPYGRTVTAKLARDLAHAGLTVVSGGAIGIDAAAHRAVLEASGRTIAVLGCGLDIDYPRENQPLFEQIVAEDRGAIVTEFPLGATPEPWRFPMRNRIISGLSMGVVVVEAGKQSGALLTAGIAAEQGRDVMAVPGNVDRPGSRGANGLIRDGAALVEDARDVLRTLGILTLEEPPADAASRPPAQNVPEPQRRLLEALSLTPKHVDAVATEVGASTPDASVQLTLLELSGLVRRLPGNCYIRVL